MSHRVDLTTFLAAYVAEADEQLQIAGKKLLSIEAAVARGERDPRGVRDLFRAMHTLKGLSSMVGVDSLVSLAHHVETLLREADRAGGVLQPNATEVLLRSVRVMEQTIRAVESGGRAPEPPSELLAALAALGPVPSQEQWIGDVRLTLEPALDRKLDGFERELLVRAVKEGKRALRVDYVPSPERAAQGVTIGAVRDRVGAVADIVRVVPLSQPGGAIAFALLLTTSVSDAELLAAMGVDSAPIHSLAEAAPVPAAASAAAHGAGDALAESNPPEIEQESPLRRNLLRVDARRVDDAMDRLSALVVTRSRLARAIAKLSAQGADTRDLVQVANENARQLRDLRTSILEVRMVRVSEVLERLPLMVRGLTRASGHQARLELDAGDAELDKAVAERLFPAIVHLVRNAVDHGIEPPEARLASGKPAEGVVRIGCSARSNTRLELTVTDDGRGIDAAAVARRAGVRAPETDAQLLDLVCRPGLSTREEVTTTSGRGLGMDIVQRIVVDELGGELAVKTEMGRGTTFTLRVPLTVAIVDGFVVECAGERLVIPVPAVEEIVEVDVKQLVTPPQGGSGGVRPLGLMPRRGETLPVYALCALLGVPQPADGPGSKALVVRRGGEPLAFVLHKVTGQQEAVVRPLVDPLVRVPGVSAATDLGDGRPTLVLDLPALVGQGPRRSRPLPAGSAPALPAAKGGDAP